MTCRSNRSNKKEGRAYEGEVVKLLSQYGFWAHRIEERPDGSQPFDVIAAKNNDPLAIDAKTLSADQRWFYISRLEENQILAFEKWLSCGNSEPLVFVKWKNETYVIDYLSLKRNGKVDMKYAITWEEFYRDCFDEWYNNDQQ